MSHVLPLEVSLIEAELYAVEQLGQDFFVCLFFEQYYVLVLLVFLL